MSYIDELKSKYGVRAVSTDSCMEACGEVDRCRASFSVLSDRFLEERAEADRLRESTPPTPAPQPAERVDATEADIELAMEVAYHLAIHGVTNDDQYRHEAAKKVAQFRLRAVAAAVKGKDEEIERLTRIIDESYASAARLDKALTLLSCDSDNLACYLNLNKEENE